MFDYLMDDIAGRKKSGIRAADNGYLLVRTSVCRYYAVDRLEFEMKMLLVQSPVTQ